MIKFTNNATSKLKTAIVAASTGLEVYTGDGGKFPTLTSGDYFMITVVSNAGFMEIMKVTGRTGDVFVVERAQEGTTAQDFDAGSIVENRWTAATVTNMINDVQATTDTSGRVQLATEADMSATSTTKVPVANLCATRTLSNLSSASTARTNLGLGTIATYNVGTGATEIPTNGSIPSAVTSTPSVLVKSKSDGKIDLTWMPDFSTITNVKWQGSSRTFSTSAPTGGVDGDVWFQYV